MGSPLAMRVATGPSPARGVAANHCGRRQPRWSSPAMRVFASWPPAIGAAPNHGGRRQPGLRDEGVHASHRPALQPAAQPVGRARAGQVMGRAPCCYCCLGALEASTTAAPIWKMARNGGPNERATVARSQRECCQCWPRDRKRAGTCARRAGAAPRGARSARSRPLKEQYELHRPRR